MNIAFHGGDQKTPSGVSTFGELQCVVIRHAWVLFLDCSDVSREVFRLLLFHVGEKPSNCFFHHAGGFHHLGKEHFARAEEVTDHAHAVHQRPFDHFQWPAVFLASGFRILVDETINPLQERVFETFLDILLTPREILSKLLSADTLVAFGKIQQALG